MIIAFLMLLLAGTAAGAQQRPPVDSRPAPPPDSTPTSIPETESQRRPSSLLRITLGLAGVYDSNIGHDEAAIRSVGTVTSADGAFARRWGRSRLNVDGTVALHQYSNTDRFDRLGGGLGARVEVPLVGRLNAGFAVEGSLGGANEDRAVTDQVMLSPRLIYRFGQAGQFRLTGAQRFRRSQQSEYTSNNRYASVSLRTSATDGPYTEFGSRYEFNDSELAINEFTRWIHSAGFVVPVVANTEIGFELQYTRQHYKNRFLEDEDGEVLPGADYRRDQKWTPQLHFLREITDEMAIGIEYEYERRTSNDFGKDYGAHNVVLMTRYRW